jgi:hypothetical protein
VCDCELLRAQRRSIRLGRGHGARHAGIYAERAQQAAPLRPVKAGTIPASGSGLERNGLIAEFDYQAGFLVLVLLDGVVGRVRRERIQFDYDQRAGTASGKALGVFEVITFDRTVVAVLSPVFEEILVGIGRGRLPDFIRVLKVFSSHGIEKAPRGDLFLMEAQWPGPCPEVKGGDGNEGERGNYVAQ